ncbi:MAG: hypothetical protein PHV34_05975 [Verrucomicrobiae bacterium]|nr:hypothetical protein [Verrucomicrobiae bacterium]
MKNELSNNESSELRSCERTIEQTKGAFVACGLALSKIRDRKLYRRDFDTFEEYCREKWGWGRQYAYQLIECAEVKMSPIGDKIGNQGQAKAIAAVPPERRKEVMEKASASGAVTAKKITEAAKDAKASAKAESKPVIELDQTGWPIPVEVLPDWRRAEQVSSLIAEVKRVKLAVKAALESQDCVWCEVNNLTLSKIQNIQTSLSCVIPYAVCPTCNGNHREKCALCRRRGFLSKFLWDSAVPEETKKIRAKGVKR